MTKKIYTITSLVTVVTTSVLLIIGKIDLTTYALLNTAIIGALGSWYKSNKNEELTISVNKLENSLHVSTVQNSRKDELINSLLKKVEVESKSVESETVKVKRSGKLKGK